MNTLRIDWRHFDQSGETCDRCSFTGDTLKRVIADLQPLLEVNGVAVVFVESLLGKADIGDSNTIFLNGERMEDLITGAKVVENCCPSCSEMIGEPTCCRAIAYQEQIYDEIPEFLLREAILRAAAKINRIRE